MSDVGIVAVAGATATCTVVAMRVYLAVRLAAIRASVATTASEYVIMEKAAKSSKAKAPKSPAPLPYGL